MYEYEYQYLITFLYRSIFETPGGVLGFIWGGLFHLLLVLVVLVVLKWRAKYRTD